MQIWKFLKNNVILTVPFTPKTTFNGVNILIFENTSWELSKTTLRISKYWKLQHLKNGVSSPKTAGGGVEMLNTKSFQKNLSKTVMNFFLAQKSKELWNF